MARRVYNNKYSWLILGCLIAFAAVYAQTTYIIHPDHILSLEVVKGMMNNGNYLSSWDKFDLPNYFKYPQTNFAGYHTSLAFVFGIFGIDPASENSYFALNFMLIIAVTAFTLWVAMKRVKQFSLLLVLCAALILNFQLFEDWHYYRPEHFVALWAALLVYAVFAKGKYWTLSIPIFFGILLATKISYLLMGVCLLAIFLVQKRDLRFYYTSIPIGILTVLLLNHSIIFEFDDFVEGIVFLLGQYDSEFSSMWLPHGYPDGGYLVRVKHALYYQFISNFGFIFLGCLALTSKRPDLRIAASTILVFVIYFSTRAVFFERNLTFLNYLSVIIFALAYDEFSGRKKAISLGFLIISAMVSAFNILMFTGYLDIKPAAAFNPQTLDDRPISSTYLTYDAKDLQTILANNANNYHTFYDVGHPAFDDLVADIDGWQIAGRTPPRLWHFPPSTAQTFHEPGQIFFEPTNAPPFEECEHLQPCAQQFVKGRLTTPRSTNTTTDTSAYDLIRNHGACVVTTQNPDKTRIGQNRHVIKLQRKGGFLYQHGWNLEGVSISLDFEGQSTLLPMSGFSPVFPKSLHALPQWVWVDLEEIIPQGVASADLTVNNHSAQDGAWVSIMTACPADAS